MNLRVFYLTRRGISDGYFEDAFSFVKEHTKKSPAYPSSKQAIFV